MRRWLAGCVLVVSTGLSHAQALVAVATNFRSVAEQLALLAEQQGGHKIVLVSGSTGKLYTQITNGAPFDVFMAADQTRPDKLVAAGLAVAESQRTYALGRLVLLGQYPVTEATLAAGDYRSLAIANPRLAPYGLAAMQTLHYMGLADAAADKIVRGENIGQAYALVATGNAELGLVAYSLAKYRNEQHFWRVPDSYHAPIRQDLVLLKRGQDNLHAAGFLALLSTSAADEAIQQHGYGISR